MSNPQTLVLSGYASEPNVIFLTWTVNNNSSLYTNQYYTISYTSNNITNYIISYITNMKLNVIDNTTYTITVTSLNQSGIPSNPSPELTITTPALSNQHGSRSGLRPFNRSLSYQLNVERICDTQQVISPYPTYIDITKKPFYQYYKIKPCNSC